LNMAGANISDIAKAAKVSTATVDRALNGRAGVSAANIQRVLTAARDLGYLPSEGMIILPSRPTNLEFFIPAGQNAFLSEVASILAQFAESLPLVGTCRVHLVSGIGPLAMTRALENVSENTDGIGLVAVDHPEIQGQVDNIVAAGVRAVTIASDIPASARSAYVGVDNRVAGRTAAQLMGMALGQKEGGRIALFLGSHSFHGHRERELGFRETMASRFPQLRLLDPIETGEENNRSRRALAALMRREPDLVGTYCIGGGRNGIVEAVRACPQENAPFLVLHDLSKDVASWLCSGHVDAVIDQNARLVAEQSVIRLLGSIAASSPILPIQHIEPRIVLRENIPQLHGS
jgi:LacI family transcriptional regulator